jgi:hypothetical protein
VPGGWVLEDPGTRAELVAVSARPEWLEKAGASDVAAGEEEDGIEAPMASRGGATRLKEEGHPSWLLDVSTSVATHHR